MFNSINHDKNYYLSYCCTAIKQLSILCILAKFIAQYYQNSIGGIKHTYNDVDGGFIYFFINFLTFFKTFLIFSINP